jgi:hypothetical protein
MASDPVETAKARHCSFCGKADGEVRALVAGPHVNICNECVALCTAIVGPFPEEDAPPERPAQAIPAALLTVGDLKAQAAQLTEADVPSPLRSRLAEVLAAIEGHLRRQP